MKKYPFLSLILLFALSMSLLPASAVVPGQADLDLFCTHAVLLDANHGEILYDMRATEKAYPASITKIMTALLVLEAIEYGQLSLDTPITAGETRMQGVTYSYVNGNIKLGEVLTAEELLYMTLLPSYADACNILAVAVDGTIEDFVDHMNRKAAELGCQNTHFTNPVGIHNENHYSTPYDLALIMKACLEYDTFLRIAQTPKYTLRATDMSGPREMYNSNALVSTWNHSGYLYDKCIGGKTGNTDEAGRCLVAAAEDNDEILISVVIGSGPMPVPGEEDLKQGHFRESKRLLEYGFNNFQRVTITKDSEPVETVKVTMSRQADEVNVKPQGSITRTLPKSMDLNDIETKITLYAKEVEAPVEAGQVMGIMTLSYNGEVYGQLDLVAVTSVERSELLYKKQQFFQFFQNEGVRIILAVVLFLTAIVILKLTVFRRKRRPKAGAAARRGNYKGTRM
ncbi:MAG: D-alanyl-D-alanine carboxypeptidase [Lawsonibacter sp.]|nr:D-alanyl-D-alanine carboxypeptidase [Lawsonibacter sp.]